MKRRLCLAAVVMALAAPAQAADVSLNVGALEVLLVPGPAHGGFYPYVGVGVAVPLGGKVTLLASLSAEWSFDLGRGGLVAVATADYALTERVGLDLNLVGIQDMPGLDVGRSDIFLGGGPGLSIFLGRWTLSPFLSFLTQLGVGGLSVVPGLNLAFVL